MDNIVLFFQSTVGKSWRDKLSGVYRYAREANWQIQVVNADAPFKKLRNAISLWEPIGCLADRGMTSSQNPSSFFKGLPVAFLDQNPRTATKDILNVLHDSAATTRMAVEELMRSDCASYVYYPGEIPAHWLAEREKTFCEMTKPTGRNVYVMKLGEELGRILPGLPKPIGVFAAHDMAAQEVALEAYRLKIKVPHELLIVGIDNNELICENSRPALSSVLPDFEKAGYEMARLLDQKIKNPKLKGITIKYGPVALCRRESTKWFPKSDARVSAALDYIRSHACNPSLHIDEIVAIMHCSRRFADLRFREITGHSILDEIHAVRFENALATLRKPNLSSIGAVASLCGYRSDPFLKRLFKRKTGLTMREWRKRNMTSRP